jgi:predicted signal transduction protein with EAL and GGDEF domain
LARAVGHRDVLARFGGDEFVVLCEDIAQPADALARAEMLAEAVREPIALSTGEYTITASVGVAVSSRTTPGAQNLVRDADAAMYRAKASGRNRVEMFDRSMREQAVVRLELENDLRQAVRRGQFLLDYQPIIEAATGRLRAFEALIRWNHPTRGRLLPEQFIPLAEETGLILDIGDYVLERALAQLATWQRDFPRLAPIGVTVNVSGRQLLDEGFASRVDRMWRASDVEAGTLGLELTESVLLGPGLPPDLLNHFRDLGIQILLDDFGTGYSSLAYLEQFAIDVLKVDQSLVARLEEGSTRAAVLDAILTMARALGLEVIAEGAANPELVGALRSLGCAMVQGHGVCSPLSPEGVVSYLAAQLVNC